VKKITLAAILAAGFVTPAAAQDSTAFGGFRLEVIGGYDRVSLDVDGFDDASGSDDGFLYGVGAGYDVSVQGFVIGVEAEYADATTGMNETVTDFDFDGSEVTGSASLDATKDLYIGARLGYAASPRTLLYVKGGYTRASAALDANGSIDGETGIISADGHFNGYRLGAGIEMLVAQRSFAKLEYRYSNYGGGKIKSSGVSVDIDEAFDYLDLGRHQVAVGVGYRF